MLAVYHHDPYTSYDEPTPAMSMYTMPPQAQYAYAAAPPPPPPQRQFGGHGTSSAFSSSANPDEDWTKISDLAERRRIQNRIAQRNYRKKLKRRMEDLERRAGEEGGPEPEKNTISAKSPKRTSPTAKPKSAPTKPPAKQDQYAPPMVQDEELLFPPAVYDDARARSHTPPVYPYAAYQPSEELIFAPPYSSSPHAVPMTTEAYPTYFLAPVPVTLPPMNHFNDAVTKREYPAHDDGMGYMHYGYVPGVEMTPPCSYDASDPHTPPLSHSFDHSANCSEASYEYPTTPLSMPGSPSMIQQ